MSALLIISGIVLIVIGILGLVRSFDWIYGKIWRSIVEIVIGIIVLVAGLI